MIVGISRISGRDQTGGLMSTPRHNLDQLLVLDAIVRTGSFAAAAKALHRVPSAVTYAIRNLEDSLNLRYLNDKAGAQS